MKDMIGAHVSIAGGIEKSPQRAKILGCHAMQIFSKNQRSWKSKPLEEEKVLQFKKNTARYDIQTIVIHASYLINLATEEKEKQKKSLNTFEDELIRGDILNIPYLVIHPGSAVNISKKKGLENIVKNTTYILNKLSPKIKLLFETTAGQGNNIGDDFEQLKYLLDNIKSNNVGICFDTCHVFASGYDLKSQYERVFNKFDEIIGMDKLFVFHLNDSKLPLGSKKDRHENIGKGLIGTKFFEKLVNDKRFMGIPMILETPGGGEKYKENIKLLRRLMYG